MTSENLRVIFDMSSIQADRGSLTYSFKACQGQDTDMSKTSEFRLSELHLDDHIV